MKDIDTFKSSSVSEANKRLYETQKADVARMRAALFACSEDPSNTSVALKQVAVLRVYHQVARIVRYLDMMDKLEDKLYQSLDYQLEVADPTDDATWPKLLDIQKAMQDLMIDSHKLLQPYLTLKTYEIMDLGLTDGGESDAGEQVMSAKTRESVRSKAQAILQELQEEMLVDAEEPKDVSDEGDSDV